MESILLIDDDEALRVALRLVLERAGYSVVVARDGAGRAAALSVPSPRSRHH